jgi:signal transduction histidine kinase/glutaredoxin-related protein
MAMFSLTFPEYLPKEELSPDLFFKLSISAFFASLVSSYLAKIEKLNLSYILFYSFLFVGSAIAIYTQRQILQVQNVMVILAVPIIMGAFFLSAKELAILNLFNLVMINIPFIIFDIKPIMIMPAYIFFHLSFLISIWIAYLRNKVEMTIVTSVQKDSKLKEIGFMAGSIAHEVQNPLGLLIPSLKAIKNILRKKLNEQDMAEVEKYLNLSEKNASRISEIVKSISSLIKSSPMDAPLPLISINQIIEDFDSVYKLYNDQYSSFIQSAPKIQEDVFVEAHRGEIVQIIYNLVKNACLSVNDLPNPKVCLETKIQNNHVQILVHDNGPGVPQAIQDRMGQALNSGSSEGLGLGLSISMAIASKNNCTLTYSRTEDTSTFNLSIPVLMLPKEITVKNVQNTISDKFSHIFLLQDNILVIFMRLGKYKLSLTDFKEVMKSELEIIPEKPFRYITISNQADLTQETKKYFNSAEMRGLFISGAIVGTSRAAASATNVFTKVLNLPYPIKMFSNFSEAFEWTRKKTK